MLRRNPRRVISLGDSFHDSGGYGRLAEADRARLASLQRGRDWVWISGNHDRELPADIGGDIVGRAVARRPRSSATSRSPATRAARSPGTCIRPQRCAGAAGSVRCRAFATDGTRMVLPAFGVLAGGLNVLDRAFQPLFAAGVLRAFLIGDGRLFPVAGAALSPD